MIRLRLPDRRPAETAEAVIDGRRFIVTIGFYPDGRPGEVFADGARIGSDLDALLDDACEPPRVFRRPLNLGRWGHGRETETETLFT